MRYLVVLAALLAGCATTEKGWDKPGASQQDFVADRGECVSRAFVAPTAFQQNMILTGCMQSKGWTWVEREAAPQTASAPREEYRVCNDVAERVSGTRNSFDTAYKAAYEGCMANK